MVHLVLNSAFKIFLVQLTHRGIHFSLHYDAQAGLCLGSAMDLGAEEERGGGSSLGLMHVQSLSEIMLQGCVPMICDV